MPVELAFETRLFGYIYIYMTIAFSSPLLTYHSHFSVPDSPRRSRNGRVLRSGTTQTPRRSNRLRASKASEVEDLAASVPTDSPRIAGRSKLKRRAPGKFTARKLEKASGHIPRTPQRRGGTSRKARRNGG